MPLTAEDYNTALAVASSSSGESTCLVYGDGRLVAIKPIIYEGASLVLNTPYVHLFGGGNFPQNVSTGDVGVESRELHDSIQRILARNTPPAPFAPSNGHAANGKQEKTSGGTPILRIGRKGRMAVALGDGAPFEFDVVKINDAWADARAEFFDEKGEWIKSEVDGEGTYTRYSRKAYEFVCSVDENVPQNLTMAEVWEFLKVVADKTRELQVFFVPKSAEGRSSPENTKLTFSE